MEAIKKEKMKYLSVCSGVEAASVAWKDIGWEAVGFSEIEPFPSAVLKYHYPDVTNFGDMTNYKDWNIDEPVDLIVGGTPCQSFSIAGLRKGLEDERGNLMLVYVRMLEHFKPKWFVWENVPGVLSSNGGKDFACFLDMVEAAGYICDVDILDARFFGVPQRRRRVFVCGQHVDSLLKQKTDLSSQTILQCLVEILHGILIESLSLSEVELQKSGLQNLSKDGVMRKIKLFGLLGERNNWKIFQDFLIGEYQKHLQELKNLGVTRGEKEKVLIQGDLFSDSKTESQFILTEGSLKKLLAGVYEAMKSFTISTGTSSITTYQIFMCSKVVLLIEKLIPLLNQSCPCYWSLVSSTLTAMKGYTSYARQTSYEIFEPMEWIQSWSDFVRQTDGCCDVVGYLGDWRPPAQVLFESESMRWDTQTFGNSGENTTSNVGKGTQTYGIPGNWIGRKPENGGNATEPMHDIAPCLTKTDRHAVSYTDKKVVYRKLSLTAYVQDESASTICSRDHKSVTDIVVYEHLPADSRVKDMGSTCSNGTARLGAGGGNTPLVHQHVVRRLTPVECERLQGFPDDYTNIPWRKSTESPDGLRYKALGNSMAVPVMKWIGDKINYVDKKINFLANIKQS